MKLDDIVATGNRYYDPQDPSRAVFTDSTIRCADGYTLSVIAGQGAYCAPYVPFDTHAHQGPFSEVEVGFPSQRPEPWDVWQKWAEDPDDPTGTVYPFVPVDAVAGLIASHGGEA